MNATIDIFAANSNSLIKQDQHNVIRCWNEGDEDSLLELKKAIDSKSCDAIVIQFNYSFFNFERFKEFLLDCKKEGNLKIILMMHSTVDPVNVMPHKRIELIKNALKQCDRILVHSVNDLNRLKNIGLIHNVTIFPHGIWDCATTSIPNKPKQYKKGEKEAFHIASYGFFLPNKGLLELIDSVYILRKRGFSIRLRMINSEYPLPASRTVIERAVRKINELDMNEEISLHTEYLKEEVCVNELGKSDLIVYPYQKTGESASGAVRFGIATGKPVAVTPTPIFDDVLPAVIRLPGFTPVEIADGIEMILTNYEKYIDPEKEYFQTAERWRDAHRFSHLGYRLYNLIISLVRNK
jgi:glycosyltransferase involved in cell wall biosynthesis